MPRFVLYTCTREKEGHMADMRATRTRQYLREAVMALLLEKPYDDITVREVCEQARVSKN